MSAIMSVGNELQAVLPRFRDATKIPIAQLNPNVIDIGLSHVEAHIALIWPYSSSTRELSLLLTEKDVRLRKSKGQVKITFYGDCAREVAKTRIGIGDNVKLGLESVDWIRTGEYISTPGKKVDWDIAIRRKLHIEIDRAEHATIVINFTAKAPTQTTEQFIKTSDHHPQTNGLIEIRKSGHAGSHGLPLHGSPSRLPSGSFLRASLDPFTEVEESYAGKARKRTKFARHSGAWQLEDDDEQFPTRHEQNTEPGLVESNTKEKQRPGVEADGLTPLEEPETLVEVEQHTTRASQPVVTPLQGVGAENMDLDFIDAFDNEYVVQDDTNSTPIMGPPPAAMPVTPERPSRPVLHIPEEPISAPTPVLRPLPSPGLALVSPLVQRSGLMTGYFPFVAAIGSELDAASHVATASQGPVGTASISSDAHADGGVEGSDIMGHRINLSEYEARQSLILTGGDAGASQQGRGVWEEDFDDAILNLQPESIQERLSADMHGNIIEAASISNSGIDLDALQQQINESSRLLQGESSEAQDEDEDMYGPPIILPRGSVSSQSLAQSQSIPEVSTDVLSPEPRSPPQKSFVIESPSGNEESDSEDEDEDSDEDAHEDVGEDETFDEGHSDHEDATEEVAVSKHTDEVDTTLAVAVTKTSADSAAASLIDATDDASLAAFLTIAPEAQAALNIDGIYELWESENLRTHLRIEEAKRASKVDSATVEPSDSPVRTDSSVNRGLDIIDDKNEASTEHEVLDIASETDEDGNDGEFREAELLRHGKQQITHTESLNEHVSEQPLLPNVTDVLTPAATQDQQVVAEKLTNVTPTNDRLRLPPSPELTQYSAAIAFATPVDASSGAEDVEEMIQVTEVIKEEQTESMRKVLPRLPRKLFTTEKISTEYFTPRRSSRVPRSSPTPAPQLPSYDWQPSSPARSRRSLRSSSPLLTRDEPLTEALTDTLRGTTTLLSYFPALSTIREHFGVHIDVIAICTSDSKPAQKARTGPKDYHTTFFLTDPSMSQDDTTIRVQIFRPRKAAVPIVNRGDIILLRNVKVQTNEHTANLLSTDSSAWAVFSHAAETSSNVVVSGPPIEYGEAEKTKAAELSKWWSSEGHIKHPDIPSATAEDDGMREKRSTSPMMTRSQARKTNSSEVDGNPPESEGDLDNYLQIGHETPSTQDGGVDARRTVPSDNPSSPKAPVRRRGHQRADSEQSQTIVHELRDGTKYVDAQGRGRSTSVIHELRDGSTYVDE